MRGVSEAGFTLIEVLVAFAIAAVLLLPLLQSFSAGIASASRTDAFTAATLVAESAIETVGPDAELVDGGGFDRQEGRYHVGASVRRYPGNGISPQSLLIAVPYEIVVTVSWQEAARMRSIALRTLRLGPPQAPEHTR
jgi:prepilin-type N-terminal cleavage/methylation domain-containing protein